MITKMFTNIEKREKFDLELRNGVEYIKVSGRAVNVFLGKFVKTSIIIVHNIDHRMEGPNGSCRQWPQYLAIAMRLVLWLHVIHHNDIRQNNNRPMWQKAGNILYPQLTLLLFDTKVWPIVTVIMGVTQLD
jgi:hypothetical protein